MGDSHQFLVDDYAVHPNSAIRLRVIVRACCARYYLYCGIIIVHGGLMFVDFMGYPYPQESLKSNELPGIVCNKAITNDIMSPSTRTILRIDDHWPPRLSMIPQCPAFRTHFKSIVRTIKNP